MTTLRDQLSRAWVFLAIPLLALVPNVWGQHPKLEPIDVEGQRLAFDVDRFQLRVLAPDVGDQRQQRDCEEYPGTRQLIAERRHEWFSPGQLAGGVHLEIAGVVPETVLFR